ncbi:MAG: hypothetical protein WB676_12490 [Bryobacteraceae bacterium]
MKFVALSMLVLLRLPLLAAIDGTVTNGTTNQPQAGVSLTLVKPGAQGMQTLGQTTSDSQGHFHFENDQPGGGPQLLQAQYQNVTYNTLLTPNMPTSGVDVRVFEATKSPTSAQILQHILVIQPSPGQTAVNETIMVKNGSNRTFANSDSGEARFFLPPAANGQVRIQVQGPGGMPLPRPAERTDEDNVFKIDYPIKPGQTEFDISYVLPVGSPETFKGRTEKIKGQPEAPVRLVVPSGVTVESPDIRPLGQEPQTQAMIYDLTSPSFSLNVTGTGSLGQGGNDSASTEDESDRPKVEQENPPVYHHLGLLAGLALAILGTGVVLLYRSSPVRDTGK